MTYPSAAPKQIHSSQSGTRPPLNNLPAPLTRFVGRQAELRTLKQFLVDERLVTIVGPGGVGKTRLALQAATQNLSLFHDGVCYVSLAGVDAPDALVIALLEACQLPVYGGVDLKTLLFNSLRKRNELLVLDNFEQLAPAAGLLVDLLQQATQIKILVTSREALNVYGEALFKLGGLSLPEQEISDLRDYAEAVQLFLQSARRSAPDFKLTEENFPAVAQICRRVDGLPLALELAATWVRSLSCAGILAEIEKDPDFLHSDWQNFPNRQRNLRGIFEYSWQLLSVAERQAAMRLSVFAGTFPQDAAQSVSGASLPVLCTLVDRSFLHWDTERNRYAVHPLVKRYLETALAADPQVQAVAREAHAAYLAAFLQQREVTLRGSQQNQALHEIGDAFEDVQRAWDWAIQYGLIEQVDACLESLFLFHQIRSRFQEGSDLFTRAIATLSALAEAETTPVRRVILRLQNRLADLYNLQGRHPEARQLLEARQTAIRALNEPAETALYLLNLSTVADKNGDYLAGRQALEEALGLARAASLTWMEVKLLFTLGYHFIGAENDSALAETYLEAGLALNRQRGDQRVEGYALFLLSIVMETRGRLDEARSACEQAVRISQELGDVQRENQAINHLAGLYDRQGLVEEALNCFEKAVAGARAIGNQRLEATAQGNRGTSYMKLGDYVTARLDYEQALQGHTTLNFRRGMSIALCNLTDLFNILGDYSLALGYAEKLLAIADQDQDRLGQAYGRLKLGHTYLGLDQLAQAQVVFGQALDLAQTLEQPNLVVEARVGQALVWLAQGEVAQALDSLEPALNLPEVRGLEENADLSIHFDVYRLLQAGGDKRAAGRLENAYQRLYAMAAQTRDERLRRLCLENVPAHREIRRAFAGLEAKTPNIPGILRDSLPDPLTRQELEVLRLLDEGLSNQQIAEKLVVAVGTVKFHAHSIYQKLGVENRTQAVLRARELGLL